MLVQVGRPYRDRRGIGHDRQDAAADPALGRQSDAQGEVARSVIMAARHHQREHLAHPLRLRIRRIVAPHPRVMRQEQPGPRQRAAIQRDGALPDIGLHDVVRFRLQVAVMPHEAHHRPVQVAALLLAGHDLVVQRHGIHAQLPRDQRFGPLDIAVHQHVHHHQCAGIDEGVARQALGPLQIDDRIERITRRLAPHPLEHPVPDRTQRALQCEHLGDALDRKARIRRTGGQHRAVQRRDRRPERAGLGTVVLGVRRCLDLGGIPRDLLGDFAQHLVQPVVQSSSPCLTMVLNQRRHLPGPTIIPRRCPTGPASAILLPCPEPPICLLLRLQQ